MRLKDFFSIERYKSVFIRILKWLLIKLDGNQSCDQVHVIEQYMYRFLKCKPCLDKGECLVCGCHMPAKMFVRTDYCEDAKWLPFMSETDWNNYKKLNNIKFILNEQYKI